MIAARRRKPLPHLAAVRVSFFRGSERFYRFGRSIPGPSEASGCVLDVSVATIPIGQQGKLEFPASDGAGRVFVNIEEPGSRPPSGPDRRAGA